MRSRVARVPVRVGHTAFALCTQDTAQTPHGVAYLGVHMHNNQLTVVFFKVLCMHVRYKQS